MMCLFCVEVDSAYCPNEGIRSQYMDIPPFLDTDVARGTVLLTLEDFAFFCDENGTHSLFSLANFRT